MSRSLSILTCLFALFALATWMISDAMPAKRVGVPRTFDQQLWSKAGVPDQDPGLRHWMLEDLIANHLAVGMSKLEVNGLLGHPDWRSAPRDEVWRYYAQGEYGREHEHLELRFDSNLALQSFARVDIPLRD